MDLAVIKDKQFRKEVEDMLPALMELVDEVAYIAEEERLPPGAKNVRAWARQWIKVLTGLKR